MHRLPEHGNRPVFFVYDSYLFKADEWASVLTVDGKQTLRGTDDDAIVIGLWVKENEQNYMLKGGFDGFYTYFATVGFTYGCTPKNWSLLGQWAKENDKLFIPCVAPGYVDLRIRPWNGMNKRDREGGAYYDRMWAAAIKAKPDYVAITSFNEWHEGTQIEPAVPKQIDSFLYQDYKPLEPDAYLKRTAEWVETFVQREEKQHSNPEP